MVVAARHNNDRNCEGNKERKERPQWGPHDAITLVARHSTDGINLLSSVDSLASGD